MAGEEDIHLNLKLTAESDVSQPIEAVNKLEKAATSAVSKVAAEAKQAQAVQTQKVATELSSNVDARQAAFNLLAAAAQAQA